jgi:hypothetical protein
MAAIVAAFAAGFLLAVFLGRSPPDAGRMLRVPPEDGLILIGRFPPGWPAEFPLPRRSHPKWAVTTVTANDGGTTQRQSTWTCFTYEPIGDGPLGSRLIRVFRQELRSAEYVLGPAEELEVSEGTFLFRFPFYYDFEKVPPDHEGFITIPEDGALELGGIECGFSVEVTNYSEWQREAEATRRSADICARASAFQLCWLLFQVKARKAWGRSGGRRGAPGEVHGA